MIDLRVPGFGDLELEHLVMDYNGTLALDGYLIDGVAEAVEALSEQLSVHVLTADTFGRARQALSGLPCALSVLDGDRQDVAKLEYVEKLGGDSVIAIGNGRNDRLMIQRAKLGIVVLQDEGAAGATTQVADVVCRDINLALDLLTHPLRLVATLRS